MKTPMKNQDDAQMTTNNPEIQIDVSRQRNNLSGKTKKSGHSPKRNALLMGGVAASALTLGLVVYAGTRIMHTASSHAGTKIENQASAIAPANTKHEAQAPAASNSKHKMSVPSEVPPLEPKMMDAPKVEPIPAPQLIIADTTTPAAAPAPMPAQPITPEPPTSTLPFGKNTASGTAATEDPFMPRLAGNHYMLQTADSAISLYRIPQTTDASNPPTYSSTAFSRWQVACESLMQNLSCFATAVSSAYNASVTIRIGAAARISKTVQPLHTVTDGPIEYGDRYRYILSVQTPPQLPPHSQITLNTDAAIATTTSDNNCDETGCYATFYVSPDPDELFHDPSGGLNVIILSNSKAYVWNFPVAGLANAIKKMDQNMRDWPRSTEHGTRITPSLPQ